MVNEVEKYITIGACSFSMLIIGLLAICMRKNAYRSALKKRSEQAEQTELTNVDDIVISPRAHAISHTSDTVCGDEEDQNM